MGKSTAAYIINNNQLLLLLRDNIPTIKDPNKWDTPGGGVEGNESYGDCILRELEEELELALSKDRLRFLWETITPKGNEEASFLIEISDFERNSLKLHEGQEMKFFSFDELNSLDFTEHLCKVYESKKEEIRKIIF